jgi:hypothetical protein
MGGGDSKEYLEVNLFNRYFTFQVDTPPNAKSPHLDYTNGGKVHYQRRHLETRFTLPEGEGKTFLFRLRAELSTAASEDLEQGMLVTLLGSNRSSYSPLEDHTSFKHNEGLATFDTLDLKPGTEYILRYDFYDRERPNGQHSHGGIQCSQPFITQ